MQAQQHAATSRANHQAELTGGDDDTLLTSKQARARVGGVSDMCIWRWMRDDRVNFPQPIKLNRRNYWRAGDLRRWQAGLSEKKAV